MYIYLDFNPIGKWCCGSIVCVCTPPKILNELKSKELCQLKIRFFCVVPNCFVIPEGTESNVYSGHVDIDWTANKMIGASVSACLTGSHSCFDFPLQPLLSRFHSPFGRLNPKLERIIEIMTYFIIFLWGRNKLIFPYLMSHEAWSNITSILQMRHII